MARKTPTTHPFTIVAYGRTYRFSTLEEARVVASEYMNRTGNIVGIQKDGE